MLILRALLVLLPLIVSAADGLMSGWASNLYGEAMCVKIPSSMGLCQSINYREMKVPNILGHETSAEIVEQSSAWQPLLGIQCHKDSQLFLCSLFAPVCIAQAPQTTIYPCRSLCEQVRSSCEAPMLSYNYPWPSMFNCSQFPEDNGLCIKPTVATSGKVKATEPAPTVSPVPRPKAANKPKVPTQSSQQCHAECADSRQFNMSHVVSAYCSSRIVLRARIKSNAPATNLRLKSPHRRHRHNSENQIGSQHLVIPRRDRRFFKGARILFNTVGPFLTEDNLARYFTDQQQSLAEFSPRKDMDFYVLSRQQFNLMRNRRRRGSLRNARDVHVDQSAEFCQCNVLKRHSYRKKYLVTAQVVRARKSLFQSHNNQHDLFKRSAYRTRATQARFHKTHFRLVKVTGLFEWNRVRPFIDYLDNFYLDKSDMCRDVARTVGEIRKADSLFF